MTGAPKLRDLQLIPYSDNGTGSFLLRDPLQLNAHMLVIPQEVAPLIYLFDGTRDVETVSRMLDFHFSLKVSEEELNKVLDAFDEAYLVENDRSRQAEKTALAEFRAAEFRTPASAGGSYPSDPAELNRMLQDYLEAAPESNKIDGIRGLLSPHIDFARGGSIYAEVWKPTADALENADLVVIIGTDHYSVGNEITLTKQNYATPYGILPTDQAVVDRLAAAIGEDKAFKGELFHRFEHSLELPLVWLHHMLGGREISVVPVLCGTMDPDSELLENFIKALKESTQGRKVFTIISGDMAHVGPAFSGEPALAETRDSIRASDKKLFELLSTGDADMFLSEITANGNANNICGVYPLYLAITGFEFTSGEQIGYAQCPADDEGTSIVSIGGIVFKQE